LGKLNKELGTATADSDLAFSFQVEENLVEILDKFHKKNLDAPESEKDPLPYFLDAYATTERTYGASPVQVQVEYTLTETGEKRLKVVSALLPISISRSIAEEKINSTVVSLVAIQRAANMAQKGNYTEARVELVSFVRLLQRTMKTVEHQDDYMGYIVQAEKLDQFMRESQTQASVLDNKPVASRDDAAAQAMFKMKAVSVDAYRKRK